MTHVFHMVDVFGESPFAGNPLAVVADAEGIDTDRMQRITRWFNLSETTFLLPPTHAEADYRVRIFTLERELPFAGHPTLGSCSAWLGAGGVPRNPQEIVQECGAGLVRIRHTGELLSFAAPPLLRSGPVDEAKRSEVAHVLGIEQDAIVEAQWVDNGPGWVGILLESADAVLGLRPARHHPRQIDIGVVGPHASGRDSAFELRAFFSDQHGTLVEDPVTGSLNASVAQWLVASGRARPPYVAAQGTALGRQGRIRVEQDSGGQIWIGGSARRIISGKMEI